MTDFERARRAMVDSQLITTGITDKPLMLAMLEVPRERFVPADRVGLAYVDVAHRLSAARSLATPSAFARLVQLAEVGHGDKVLDLGCGTGYSTAVLARLGARVTGVESDPDLAAAARETLADLGLDATIQTSWPEDGARAGAPFDVIVVEGSVDEVPKALFAQLADGGRLAAVLRQGATGVAQLFVRAGKDVAPRPAFNLVLPPLSPARQKEPGFVF